MNTNKLNSVPLFIDLEASGFGRGSYPIEVGVADENQKVMSLLIKPEDHWTHWDEGAAEIHGISRDVLMKAGISAKDVALSLNEKFIGKILYSDGWSFDSSWLGLLYNDVGIFQRFKLETVTKILTQAQLEIWDKTKKEIGDAMNHTRHRASVDAKILQQTYIKTLEITSK
ncbi:hypothetical protein [Marinicellulosiphila megalodicopiae]|uniref:3'-5' exonuclease n=1 Tax=Marinicellulosiphila megalodicopiae TaxID=2724896 RepID=UPI003BAE8C77